MKKTLCLVFGFILILCSVLLCSCGQNGEDGIKNDGKFEYTLSVDETYYILTSNKNKNAQNVVIESTHKGLPVKTIASKAFVGCMSIKTITVPDSVSVIEKGAFAGCTGIEEISLPFVFGNKEGQSYFGYMFTFEQYPGNSYVPNTLKKINITGGDSITNGAFSNCDYVNEISIANTVTSIETSAFRNCQNLITINIPNSVKTIGNDAFEGCESLKNVHAQDLVGWCQIGFSNREANPLKYGNLCLNGSEEVIKTLVIPTEVTSINSYAFFGCDSIETVVIPDSVTRIGRGVFGECTSIYKIELPFIGYNEMNGQNAILGSIFADENTNTSSYDYKYVPESLKTVVVTNSTSIPALAFNECPNIRSIKLPDNLKTIGNFAFAECVSLTGITIPEGVITIGNNAFQNCTALNDVNIPNGVMTIDEETFKNCYNLSKVKLGSGLTQIGKSAFLKCSAIQEIILPQGLVSIGSIAFGACSSLRKIVIPKNVNYIGSQAFAECSSLTEVTFETVIGWKLYDHPISRTWIDIDSNLASNPVVMAKHLRDDYSKKYWGR
ncbi:MAG: leucine-rich repeat domain-containing protein [Clostridia bacterium]|nr:leucine-rich repeat domain-containing protein [Clostridia bacterium]